MVPVVGKLLACGDVILQAKSGEVGGGGRGGEGEHVTDPAKEDGGFSVIAFGSSSRGGIIGKRQGGGA